MLISWYRERILDLTLRIERALLRDAELAYIEELEESRSRFEELLRELLNSEEQDDTQTYSTMSGFDFQAYFDQLAKAKTDEARREVDQHWDDYAASLTEAERQQFKDEFNQYLKTEAERFRRMADQAEEMFGVKRAA
ncbi:MAG: hypothetical protein LH606_19975 [Cytophagaceae bacterium]|nr:hypothetical protein [Cytophagaceae bacterium]